MLIDVHGIVRPFPRGTYQKGTLDRRLYVNQLSNKSSSCERSLVIDH